MPAPLQRKRRQTGRRSSRLPDRGVGICSWHRTALLVAALLRPCRRQGSSSLVQQLGFSALAGDQTYRPYGWGFPQQTRANVVSASLHRDHKGASTASAYKPGPLKIRQHGRASHGTGGPKFAHPAPTSSTRPRSWASPGAGLAKPPPMIRHARHCADAAGGVVDPPWR